MELWQVGVLVAVTAAVAAILTKSLSGSKDVNSTPLILGTAMAAFRWLSSGPMREISSTSLSAKSVGYSIWRWSQANNRWELQATVNKNAFGYAEPIEPPNYPSIPNNYTVKVIYPPK
jgi:hypothetical protein